MYELTLLQTAGAWLSETCYKRHHQKKTGEVSRKFYCYIWYSKLHSLKKKQRIMEILQPVKALKAVYVKKEFSRSSRVNKTLGYSGFRSSVSGISERVRGVGPHPTSSFKCPFFE